MSVRDHIRLLRFLRRPRMQFGLRSLLVGTLILCLALGWHVDRVHRQRRAVAALKQAGARIEYSISKYNHYDMGLERAHATDVIEIEDPRTVAEWLEWMAPRRLRSVLGVDFFRHVDYVDLFGVNELAPVIGHLTDLRGVRILKLGIGSALDDDLLAVGQLRDLTHLDASFSTITDAGLVFLAPLRKLEHLDLSDNAITGTGLVHLSNLRRLNFLDLGSNPIEDPGLAHLANLRCVKGLFLSRTKINGVGLHHLAAMSDLKTLDLRSTQLTDGHSADLAALQRLEFLSINFTAVGDAGLQSLRRLSKLSSLDIGYTLITDKSVELLTSLAGLKWLDISGTAITDEGLRELGALPLLKNILVDDTAATPDGVACLQRRLPKADINFRAPGNIPLNQARVLMDVGLWRQALETLGKTDGLYLRTTEGLRYLARCHAALGQCDDAEREYCQVLEQISHNTSVQRWYREEVRREVASWPELFERVRRARADDPWLWASSASRAVVDGRWTDALRDYCRAADCPIRLDPNDWTGRDVEEGLDLQHGISRLVVSDVRGALRVRDQLVQDGRLVAAARLQLLAPQGTDCPPTIAAWLRGCEEWQLSELLAISHLRSGRFAQVLAEMQPAHAKEHYGLFWFSRAIAHHYLNQHFEAQQCIARGKQSLDRFTKEVRIDRRYDYAWCLLAAEVLRREAASLISDEE